MEPDLAHRSAGAVLLAVLRQGRWLGQLSLGLWALGALALGFSHAGLPVSRLWLAAQAVGLLAQYAALRVRLDLELFEELYRPGHDPEAFDAALSLLLPQPAGRPLADRARGALRWWRRTAALFAVQGLLALLALIAVCL